jgi:uncharacterized protein
VLPGRTAEARGANPSELRQTFVLRLPIEEGSAKVRAGDSLDDDEDIDLPVWAGTVPLRLVPGDPVPNADFDRSLAAPPTPDRLVR